LVSPGFDLSTLKLSELAAVNDMREWWSTLGGVAGAKGDVIKRDKEGHILNEEGPLKSKKSNYISGMKPNGFYDIVAEVHSPARMLM
jgi:hypothetical protein